MQAEYSAKAAIRYEQEWPPRATLGSALQVLVQPGVDGLVPLDRVGRLEHPVILVREHQQAAFHPMALQRGGRFW